MELIILHCNVTDDLNMCSLQADMDYKQNVPLWSALHAHNLDLYM